MIKEAIEKILGLGYLQMVDVDGIKYADVPNHRTIKRLVPPDHHIPAILGTCTLESIKEYIAANDITVCRKDFFLHVEDYGTVKLFDHINPENDNARFCYLKAKLNADPFRFGQWHPLEDFIIALQAQFVPNKQVDALIDHLGALANETIIENKDDGFSQSLQVKTGIQSRSKVTVKNPLTLQPYRTFLEVRQPVSNVIFRIRNKPEMSCSLHIADGGKWKLEAVKNIAEYLRGAVDIPVVA